jgi:hypothetical protein
MCDNCGFVFSENQEGWSNMTGNRMVRNTDTGKMEPKNASVDYCGDCTENMAAGAGMQRPKSPDTRAQITNGNGGGNGQPHA